MNNPDLERRAFVARNLHTLSAISLAAFLPACGFQLRGTPTFAFSSIFVIVSGDAAALGAELRRRLAANSALQVLEAPGQLAQAQVVLEILAQQREKVAVGLNASGQVREFQLRTRVRFKLRNQQGTELIAETEIAQQRDISYNDSAALAKEVEELVLFRDQESDVAQQIMRRLATLKAI